MRRAAAWLLVVGLALGLAGCAMRAENELPKLKVGMTEKEVTHELGQPVKTLCVRFPTHQRDYLVWEYPMIPDQLTCPSEGAARAVTGIATLGLSEIAWSHAKAQPHWVYFLDGFMVFAGRGFDCAKDQSCKVSGSPVNNQCP